MFLQTACNIISMEEPIPVQIDGAIERIGFGEVDKEVGEYLPRNPLRPSSCKLSSANFYLKISSSPIACKTTVNLIRHNSILRVYFHKLVMVCGCHVTYRKLARWIIFFEFDKTRGSHLQPSSNLFLIYLRTYFLFLTNVFLCFTIGEKWKIMVFRALPIY